MPVGVIIGFGVIAQGHLAAYNSSTNLEVVAVVDTSEMQRVLATTAGLRAYATLDEMLRAESPDFLDICTPPDSHGLYLKRAMDLRLPVVCEKPMLSHLDLQPPELLEQLRSKVPVVYPSQNYRYAPVFREVQTLVESGAIGLVSQVNVGILRAGHARGAAGWIPDWRRISAVSEGGILRDHGPHAIYIASSLSNIVPVKVSCITGRMLTAPYENEDTALLKIQGRGDTKMEISLSWASGARDSRYLFIGSCGFISVVNDEVQIGTAAGVRRIAVESQFDDPSHTAWFVEMLKDFETVFQAPATQAERVHGLVQESLMTTRVIDEAYKSSSSGGTWRDIQHDNREATRS